ncbi:MAG: hypothetical protein QOI71_3599 [Gaiellales bacterium]|nr:hypothetical protein [Gaiellales bacterium]
MPRRLPSPALIVASLALAVALGGTTYAATALPKNSVGTKQLKSGSVSALKLARGSVTSRHIKDHTIVAADLAKNAYPDLPGKVASAGHADSAGRADTAGHADTAGSVSGATFTTIDYRASAGTPAASVVAANGLTISAACDAAGSMTLSISSATGDAQYALLATDETGNVRGDSFSAWTGEEFDIAARLGLPDLTRQSLHLTYQNPSGKPVLVEIAADGGAFNGAATCYAGGYAIS